MAELTSTPFAVLASRLFSELVYERAAFGLPQRVFNTGGGERDLSLAVHGASASTPLESVDGHTEGVVDLMRLRAMEMLRLGATGPLMNNFIGTALPRAEQPPLCVNARGRAGSSLFLENRRERG